MKQYKNQKKKMKGKKYELKDFILLEEEESITKETRQSTIKKAKTKTQIKEIFTVQKSAIKNSLKLYDKRADIINASLIKISISEI